MANADLHSLHPARHSRNAICIGCGSSRALNGLHSPRSNEVPFPTTRLASPRFATTMPHLPLASSPSPTTPSFPTSVSHLAVRQAPQLPQLNTKFPVPQHPILTPSGRTLAIGGKVQNISGDSLAPVLMFWPDNEPLPEPGQVRPALLSNLHVRRHFWLLHFGGSCTDASLIHSNLLS